MILSPTDPTHSAAAAPLVLNVVGHGDDGAVHIVDQGSVADVVRGHPAATRTGRSRGRSRSIRGDAGDPNKGWHKLVFDQGGAASHPVFVSVGIDPPTVEFPRSGAEIDCSQDDPSQNIAIGTLPYPQDVFGRLRVMEETGRVPLAFVGAESRIIQPQQPGDPIRFLTTFNPGPGRHVIYFFQAPDPPAQATQDEIDAHFRGVRAPGRHADEPHRRRAQAAALPDPAGWPGIFGGRGANGGVFTNLPPPGQGPLVLGASNCGSQADAAAEHPVRGAQRGRQRAPRRTALHPARRRRGPLGDHRWRCRWAGATLTLAQVERLARGRRLERELPVERDRRRRAVAGRADHHRAARHHRRRGRAEGRAGLLSGRHGRARDRRCQRARRLRARRPARPSAWAGTRCCAPPPIRRPALVGLAEFAVTVVDGPPTIQVSDVVARGGPADGDGAGDLPGPRLRRGRHRPDARVCAAAAEPVPAGRGHAGHLRGRPITRIRARRASSR